MSFAQTETQIMLADMLSRLLAAENEFEARRHRLSGDAPARLALWPILAEQGVLGAAFTEEMGGFGGTMRDLAVMMELAGRSLVVEPLLANAICGRALAAAGETDLLAELIAGERVLAFAHMEGFDPFALPETTAHPAADGYLLTGRKTAVRHGDLAHGYVVTAALDGAPACFLVEAEGVARESFRLIDASSAATLEFKSTPARLLDAPAEDALLWALVGLAAEVSGIAAALNEATFAYLNTRKQFGVPLASFQALQHRAADMFAAAEEVRILTGRAIDAVDAGGEGRFALASAVKVLADTAGRKIGHEAVQLHGGMGVSDELNVSHHMRRLAAIRAEFGGAEMHRARFAALSGV